MKKLIFLLCAIWFTCSVLAQISEGKSGVKQFNISKKASELSKIKDETRTVSDTRPPVITVLSPEIQSDSLIKTNSKILTIKGKVEDEGGIFEVIVNGTEAKVGADGTFFAEIPVAIGRNTIKIQAADVALNKSLISFQAERSAAEISEAIVSEPPKPANTYSIDFINPESQSVVTPSDKFNLKVCIKSTAPIDKILVTRNGTFLTGYLSKQIRPSADCAFLIDEIVQLRLGFNDIKLELYASDDTISKNITIEYSLYAAKNYALLIGNEKYDDPAITELSQPVRDATELYNVLTQDYNFDPGNVIFLKNPTKADIIGTLHQLRSKIKPEDNFLIFYAGHGFWDEGMGVGYWLPRDAAKNNPVNWLPNTDLTNYLGAIKSKHTLLIADACFSGGIFKTRTAFSNEFAIEMLYQLNSRKAITSGTLTEVPDRSVFFQYLIKNLKENTADYLSSEELFSKMRMAVINNSENVPQFGTIQNVGDEGGDFIFIKRKK
ncbi:MAG: caspase family protein [Bacteroidales bacterium]